MKKAIILLICASFALNLAQAQTAMPDTGTRNFIIKASIGNLQEINSGKLAAQKGASAEVKTFGNKMIMDHSKAQAKMLQLAKVGGYMIPHEATDTPQPDMMLTKANGRDFDRTYIHMMVPDHRSTVLMFETYAISGKDPNIKAFVIETLPTLKEHLVEIKAIDDKMKDLVAK